MIIFPSNPLRPRQPDESFQAEYDAARECGFKIGFVDIELMLGGEVVLRFPDGEDEKAIYRGWILKPELQERLAEALEPSCQLINSVADYKFLYSLPNWIRYIDKDLTPRTVGVIGRPAPEDINSSYLGLEIFGDKPLVVKDFLKSRKHEWFDACYISSASDPNELKRVVTNFLDLQGDDFHGGLVFREFVKLKKIGIHSKSRMPLTNEHRYFMMGQKVLAHYPYWSEGDYDGSFPPDLIIQRIASKFKPDLFYTIDMAEKEEGGWIVIEIGDGGSCGIPENGDPKMLYQNLS